MKKITFTFLLLSFYAIGYTQNTYIPDDNFEQALIDQGYDSGPLDDYVPTANINTITGLSISNKGISDLTGIEDFTALGNLLCWNNNLTSIDLSQNLALYGLKINSNQLTTLDLSNNTALTYIKCYGNLLTSLNLSNNPNLDQIRCESNQLTSLNVQNGNNGIITTFKANANTNLNCINVDNVANSDANWTDIDSQTSFSEDCSALSTNEFDFNNSISMYPNPTSSYLTIKTPSQITITKVEVYSLLGKKALISTTGNNTLNVSQLASGIYVINITSSLGNISKKLIID